MSNETRKGYWFAAGYGTGKEPEAKCRHHHKTEKGAVECCKKHAQGSSLYWITSFQPACRCGRMVDVRVIDRFACVVKCDKCRATDAMQKLKDKPTYILTSHA